MPELAVILVGEYRADYLEKGFERAFSELRLADVFRPGEKIVIKPNMLAAIPPERHVTPHPAVFRALAQNLTQLGVCLTYGDSPATDTPLKAARTCGYEAVARELGIALGDFVEKTDIRLEQGIVLKRLPLALGVAGSDGLVSLAKLKTHAVTGLTGVIKNLFGVIPGLRKATYHSNYPDPEMFCQMLVDILAYIKPRLSVLDAIVAMEGNGPRNGNPSQVGAVILSVDPVAADAAATFLVGVDPCLIRTTRLAATQKLGQADLTKIDCCLIQPGEHGLAVQRGPAGELLEPHRRLDFKATLNWQSFMALLGVISTPLLKRFILNRPVIDEQMCTRCACCTGSCPLDPKAIRQPIDDMVPSYDYARCIRCYCCQEVCPSGAISVRRTLIGKILHT